VAVREIVEMDVNAGSRELVAAVVRFATAMSEEKAEAANEVLIRASTPWMGYLRVEKAERERAWKFSRRAVTYASKLKKRGGWKSIPSDFRAMINELLPTAVPAEIGYRIGSDGALHATVRALKPTFSHAVAIGLATLVDEGRKKPLYEHLKSCRNPECSRLYFAMARPDRELQLKESEERKQDWERRTDAFRTGDRARDSILYANHVSKSVKSRLDWERRATKVRYSERRLKVGGLNFAMGLDMAFDAPQSVRPKKGKKGGQPPIYCSDECRAKVRNSR
jgi:hypothetical protein